MNARFAKTPEPPYYAVIFTNQHSGKDADAYERMADKMVKLGATMPGYLGIETTRDSEGFAITVSYWESEEAITNWKANTQHLFAQAKGKSDWYSHYELRVAKIERAYSGPAGR